MVSNRLPGFLRELERPLTGYVIMLPIAVGEQRKIPRRVIVQGAENRPDPRTVAGRDPRLDCELPLLPSVSIMGSPAPLFPCSAARGEAPLRAELGPTIGSRLS